MDLKETFGRLGTLGGKVHLKPENQWLYTGSPDNKNLTKERLFGRAGRGSLHPGMPVEHQIAAGATQSDTRQTLIRELVEQSHFTRREAEEIVSGMIQNGTLEEIDDQNLGKVLVFRGRR